MSFLDGNGKFDFLSFLNTLFGLIQALFNLQDKTSSF